MLADGPSADETAGDAAGPVGDAPVATPGEGRGGAPGVRLGSVPMDGLGTQDGERTGGVPKVGPGEAITEVSTPDASGPPGSGVFSLEDREAPGLYFAGWLLSVGGAVAIVIASMAQGDTWPFLLAVGGFVVLGLGLAAAAGYQVLARASRERGRYRGPSPLLVYGVVVCLTTVVASVPLRLGLLDTGSSFGFLVGLLIVVVGYVVGVWLFAVRTGALTWRDMGWPTVRQGRLRRALRDIGVAVAVMVPATIVVGLAGNLLAIVLGVEPPAVVPAPRTSGEALAVAVAAALLAPFGEEVFFRGFALTSWLADLGPTSALIRSTLFFAVVHIVNITTDDFATGAGQALLQFLVILPLGAVLGLLFLRRGLVAAIAGHATYNGMLLAALAADALLRASR